MPACWVGGSVCSALLEALERRERRRNHRPVASGSVSLLLSAAALILGLSVEACQAMTARGA